MFHNINSYRHWFITTKVVNEVKNDCNKEIITPTQNLETNEGENNNIRKPRMILPYASDKGLALTKKNLQRALPTNIESYIVYTGTMLSSELENINDPTQFEKQHEILY